MIDDRKRSGSNFSLKKTNRGAAIIARLDRIPIWTLPSSFIWIMGIAFLFTFFGIFDINVSFVQMCAQIVPGCTMVTADKYLGLPVLMNLLGYIIGTLILSPLADRYGRRDILAIGLVIAGLGSLYTALVNDYPNFILARTVTGIGIGANLAIITTYISEIAPNQNRAKYTSLLFIMSSVGSFLAIWVALYLTTSATPFPLGLPFAVAGPHFTTGWRLVYLLDTPLAAIGLVSRLEVPESMRWLVSRGRDAEAERAVAAMEKRARTLLSTALPPVPVELPILARRSENPFNEILNNSLYLKRTTLLVVIWLVGYITVYSIAAGFTTLLVALHYIPPEAGLIAALGAFGFIASALFGYFFAESLERKFWLPISAVLTLIGGIMIALGAASFAITTFGAILLFFGFNLWIPMTYTWSLENYPTRARTTGFALVDGVGHAGGGIGLTFIASIIVKFGPLLTFLFLGGFLLLAAFLAQFGTATRGRRLDEVAP